MTDIFIKLLNMSITASYLCIAVMVIRLIFRKMPRWISCILWGLVAIRLLLPFSFESFMSLIPSSETIPSDITLSPTPHISSGIPYLNSSVNPIISEAFTPTPYESVNPLQVVMFVLAWLWLIGMVVMLIYSAVSYIILRRKTRESIKTENGFFICDNIDSPFILGIIRPKIFIPSYTDENDIALILAHEKIHLKRYDHLWKPFGFLLLSVYWFNPFMWIAYILLCRDIEGACDEKVIKEMGTDIKKPYSEALVNCSVPKKLIKACPLAFGETDIKSRIVNVLNYKKPALWVIVSAVVISIILSVCFLTNPVSAKITDIDANGQIFDNVSKLQLYIGEAYIYTTEDPSDELQILKKVRIQKNPADESRDESRDKSYRIEIDDKTSININESFSLLWIDDGVKPSYSYNIENPDILMDLFSIDNYAEKMVGVYVKVNSVSHTDAGTTFSVKWHNTGNEEITYGEMISVEYKNGDTWEEIELPENFAFILIGYLLKPYSTETKDYFIPVSLTKSGTYRVCLPYSSDDGHSFKAYGEFAINSSVSNTGGADEPSSVTVTPSKKLTLDDVIRLSKKGEALTLSDFDDYIYEETGSGLYIRLFKIDEMFRFSIGFTSMQDNPLYYYIYAEDGREQLADIRYTDAEEYINEHKDNPIVKNISYSTWRCVVDKDGSNLSNFVKLATYRKNMHYSHIQMLPCVVISSTKELTDFRNAAEKWADFDISTENYTSFNEICQEYDDEFFSENSLIIAYHSLQSDKNDLIINRVSSSENKLNIFLIEQTYLTQTNTAKGIFTCGTISKEDLQDISEISVSVRSENPIKSCEANIYKTFEFINIVGAQWSPEIELNKDGSFSLFISAYSSYFGTGKYIEAENKLTLLFDDGIVMSFDIVDDALLLNKGNSSDDLWFFRFPDNTLFIEKTE